jgi:hypothetical protein
MKKIADDISFRLLATKSHPDYEWLVETLETHVKELCKKAYEFGNDQCTLDLNMASFEKWWIGHNNYTGGHAGRLNIYPPIEKKEKKNDNDEMGFEDGDILDNPNVGPLSF